MAYLYVFLSTIIVDLVPFVGPPAWTMMVYFQIKYSLDIWLVLVIGVTGSAIGRYLLSRSMPAISERLINTEKKRDIELVGEKLSSRNWQVQLFIIVYTLVPLPSTPLFTAAGIAKVKPVHFIPSFIVGKFTSDMIMVLSGDYAAKNLVSIANGMLSWKSIVGAGSGILIILAFLCIDWRLLLMNKKFGLNFKIWK